MSRLPGIIIGLCFILGGCSTQPAPKAERKARVLQVHSEILYPTLMFPARSRPADSVNTSFRVGGPLIELPVLVGQELKKGDAIGRIDPRDYQTQVQSIEGSLLQMEATLRLAESESRRFSTIYERDPGAVSQIVVEQKKEAVNTILGQMKTVQASLETAKRALEDTTLRAPFNSTVVAVFVDNFQYVQAAQSIARVVSKEEIDVLIDVPDRIISSIKGSDNIYVQFDGVPGMRFPAKIKEISTEASQTTRTFPVTLSVIPPEGVYIFPGMTGTAYLKQIRPRDVREANTFKLPISALISTNGNKSLVWVADPKTWQITAKPVEIITLAHQYSVVAGLSDDDWVVVSGASFLTDKQTISPLTVRIDEWGEIFQQTASEQSRP